MKNFGFLLLLAALCGCLSLTGCSDDDRGGGAASALVGTWTGSHTYYNPAGGYKTNYIEFVFRANGTGTCQVTTQVSFTAAAFSYTVRGSSVNCVGVRSGSDGSTEAWTASLEYAGGKLIAGYPYPNYGELTKID